MRITKLHLLILFVLVTMAALFFYVQKVKQDRIREEKVKAEIAMQQKAEELAAMQKAAEAQMPASSPEEEKKAGSEVQYKVQKGDTLWSIAKKKEHFGQGHRWYDIWKANEGSLDDFDRLVTGQTLVVPLDKPEGYVWPKTSEDKKEKLLLKGRFRKPHNQAAREESPPPPEQTEKQSEESPSN